MNIREFWTTTEHACAKLLLGIVAIIAGAYIYIEGMLGLPPKASTMECESLQRNLDFLSIHHYTHERHFAFDLISCYLSLDDGVTTPLLYERILPVMRDKKVYFGDGSKSKDASNIKGVGGDGGTVYEQAR